jgi:tRNA/rRNA methyltransferase
MAGTDRSRLEAASDTFAPAIILTRPQIGQNIGAAARAMLNCGLSDMRLVAPRDGWPNPNAIAMASGALEVLDGARVFETLAEAVADLSLVYATTARGRDMVKSVLTPREAAVRLRAHKGHKAGLIFGPERAGLTNDEASLADAIIEVPLNPMFSSLNLAQAVLLTGYEWYQAGNDAPAESMAGQEPPVTVEDREFFYGRLERELEACGFLYPPELAPTIKRNLRNMFNRAQVNDQDIRTMHGVLSALLRKSGPEGR